MLYANALLNLKVRLHNYFEKYCEYNLVTVPKCISKNLIPLFTGAVYFLSSFLRVLHYRVRQNTGRLAYS